VRFAYRFLNQNHRHRHNHHRHAHRRLHFGHSCSLRTLGRNLHTYHHVGQLHRCGCGYRPGIPHKPGFHHLVQITPEPSLFSAQDKKGAESSKQTSLGFTSEPATPTMGINLERRALPLLLPTSPLVVVVIFVLCGLSSQFWFLRDGSPSTN